MFRTLVEFRLAHCLLYLLCSQDQILFTLQYCLFLSHWYWAQGLTRGRQLFLCWTPTGHARGPAFFTSFCSCIKTFLARSMILQLPQNNFILPLCHHGALQTFLIGSMVLLLLYLACSSTNFFCISRISV